MKYLAERLPQPTRVDRILFLLSHSMVEGLREAIAAATKMRNGNKEWKLCPACGSDYLRETECLPSEQIIFVCPTCGHEEEPQS